MILGIDATNIVSGGGLTHCKKILLNNKFKEHGFSKVIIWSSKNTLDNIASSEFILKKTHYLLNKKIFIRIFWNIFFFKRAIMKGNCDALLVLGGYSLVRFKPTVTISQNMLPFEPKEIKNYGISLRRFKFAIIKYLQLYTFSNSEGIIFLSNYAKDQIGKKIKLHNKNTKIVPHGIDESFYINKNNIREFSDNLKNTKPFKFIYVSTVDMYKHQWNVIKAVGKLKNDGYKVQLDLIGDSYKPALKKMLNEIDLVDKNRDFIFYHGSVLHKNLHKFYEKSDLIIYASSCENLPIILLEGMATSIPIASSNYGPMQEVLGNYQYYFNPYNFEDIYEKIKKMMLNYNSSLESSKATFKKTKLYSWEECRSSTFSFMANVIQDKRST